MLPDFLISETTVRESGESPPFRLDEHCNTGLVLTLAITHAMEQQSLDMDLLESIDGRDWSARPIASFTRKFYCGTYQLLLPHAVGRFLKAVWRVNRWGRGDERPFFRFYLFVQESRSRAAGAA